MERRVRESEKECYSTLEEDFGMIDARNILSHRGDPMNGRQSSSRWRNHNLILIYTLANRIDLSTLAEELNVPREIFRGWFNCYEDIPSQTMNQIREILSIPDSKRKKYSGYSQL